jgi:hypothetical protein
MMHQDRPPQDRERILRKRRSLGWLGTVCLLLIIPIKLVRLAPTNTLSLAIDIAPSILGPPGLLFLLLSSTGKLSRFSLLQTTLLATAIALGLEFAQLLPRPGLLAYVRYTFDPLDLGASLLSIAVAYGVGRVMIGQTSAPG